MNDLAVSGIIKIFAPQLQKLLTSGKVEELIQNYKREAIRDRFLKEGESCEILLSTEDDGKEYISIVIVNSMRITEVLKQQQLSDFVNNIIKQVQ